MTIKEICDRLGRAFSASDAESAIADRGVCVSCGFPIRGNQEVAFTGEHLRCYLSQLEPHDFRLRDLNATRRSNNGPDRRRHPRYPATCRLRLWFGDLGFTNAHAENVSTWGIGIALPTVTTAASLLKPGRTVGVEVFDEDGPVFRTNAAVRHRVGTAVGVECTEPLPAELLARLESA